MKTEEELKRFYSDILITKLEKIEKLRIESRNKYYTFLTVILIFLAIVVWCASYNKVDDIVVLAVFFGPIGLFIFLSVYELLKIEYVKTFKKEIIGELVHFYDNKLRYSPEKGILASAINISGLFMANEDEASDYVEGQLGETFIQFSKVNLADHNFSGIFMIATFQKPLHGNYRFIPKKYVISDSLLAKTLNKIDSGDFPLIKIDNADFEKEFVALGSDEMEVRKMLTPSFIARMLELRRKAKNDLFISVTRSRMFLAFGIESFDVFEPKLGRKITFSDVEKWGRSLQLAIGIVEEFGFNKQ